MPLSARLMALKNKARDASVRADLAAGVLPSDWLTWLVSE
jgi:hypothetical protein